MIVTLLAPVLISSCFSASAARMLFEPFLALGALDGRRIGKERQDLRSELDQARRRGVACLDLLGIEPVDELKHAILERRVGVAAWARAGSDAPRPEQSEPTATKRTEPEQIEWCRMSGVSDFWSWLSLGPINRPASVRFPSRAGRRP